MDKPKWLADQDRRTTERAESAVCAVANGVGPTGSLRWSTDEAVAHAEHAIRVFNRGAEQLDSQYGFPLRLRRGLAGSVALAVKPPTPRPIGVTRQRGGYPWAAEAPTLPRAVYKARSRAIGILTWLSSRPDLRTDYANWMLDFLLQFNSLSLERLEGVTTFPRGHVYYRRLRKNAMGRRYLETAVILDQKVRIAEGQLKTYRHGLFHSQASLDKLVLRGRRTDSDLREFPAGWPHGIEGAKFGAGVLVPMKDPEKTMLPGEHGNDYLAPVNPVVRPRTMKDDSLSDDDPRWQRKDDPATE
jgi:hypothetical protein